MSAHDGLPRHRFGDIEFPGETTELHLQIRHHVHEYPHAPGGAPEKLGRALYRVTVRIPFHATFPGYPGLYPDAMNKMRGYADQLTTLQFRHPTAGEFPAFITSFRQVKNAKVRSGELVDAEFLEDQAATFALAALTSNTGPSTIGPTAAQFATAFATARKDLAPTANDLALFDAIQQTVNSVLAYKDTSQLYGNRYGAAVQQLINQCAQFDQLQSMQDARAWPVIDVLMDLWAAAVTISNDLQNKRAQLATYTVPFPQSIIQIATTLYGDASRQGDILSLNPIDDPARVPVGFPIRYYPPTQQQLTGS